MTYVLWAARGDLIAAVAPSASVFRGGLLSSARPMPADAGALMVKFFRAQAGR